MGWESIAVVGFDLGPLLQGQTRIVHKIMCWESIAVVGFDLGPSIKVKRGYPNLKVLITRLLLVLELWNGKPKSRKSWAGSLLV